MTTEQTIQATIPTGKSYQWCHTLAHTHYENFPVASWLLPRHLRNPVAAIYAFARSADDIADEGNADATLRLQQLDELDSLLTESVSGTPPDTPLFQALAHTIHTHTLPISLFQDLLDAFRQDVIRNRYDNIEQVMDYCRRSANPIGRLLLHVTGNANEQNLKLSDAVCSALQWINFLQDIGQDYHEHNRIYLPLDEMQRFGISEADIEKHNNSPEFSKLMRFQIERTSQLLCTGSPIGKELKGRFGLELRAIIFGGSLVLKKLLARTDHFHRPRLSGKDRLQITFQALKHSFI